MVKTKNQKFLESFKTEKLLNKILWRFSEKQSIDLSKQSVDFCLTAKAKTKLKQIWQHYTEVPEEKQSFVSKKKLIVLLWQQIEHFS